MTIIQTLSRLIKDPPPEHAFEISEAGISYARGTSTSFQAFEPGTIVVSPSADNILRPEMVASMIGAMAPANGVKKRRPAALILPDYAARVTVLDFDSFPTVAAEQLPLVKFRIKKTIPFDIESAAVSYFVQPTSGSKKVEVLAVTMAFDIVARYEALFRAAGFHPGAVTTSSLAALNLC
jgi:type IV pilus assembly protein PilM